MKVKTKELTLTALLTALAIVIPMVMPVKVVMPPFTATLASHTPLILAMFLSPLAAVLTAIGSAIGFFFTFSPIVAARAATHVFFTLAGAYLIRKNRHPVTVVIVTLLLHSLSDMATVYIAAELMGMTALLNSNSMGLVQLWLGLGTAVHHLVDFFIAYLVMVPLCKAKIMNPNLLKGGKKHRETVSSNQ
ncbi:MAG: ECF transporter S component [Clostridia bacterium]|nr:ECF transporter S component [Clostridia bacterium]